MNQKVQMILLESHATTRELMAMIASKGIVNGLNCNSQREQKEAGKHKVANASFWVVVQCTACGEWTQIQTYHCNMAAISVVMQFQVPGHTEIIWTMQPGLHCFCSFLVPPFICTQATCLCIFLGGLTLWILTSFLDHWSSLCNAFLCALPMKSKCYLVLNCCMWNDLLILHCSHSHTKSGLLPK